MTLFLSRSSRELEIIQSAWLEPVHLTRPLQPCTAPYRDTFKHWIFKHKYNDGEGRNAKSIQSLQGTELMHYLLKGNITNAYLCILNFCGGVEGSQSFCWCTNFSKWCCNCCNVTTKHQDDAVDKQEDTTTVKIHLIDLLTQCVQAALK